MQDIHDHHHSSRWVVYDHQLNRSSLAGVLVLFTMEESKSTRKAQLTSFVLGHSPICIWSGIVCQIPAKVWANWVACIFGQQTHPLTSRESDLWAKTTIKDLHTYSIKLLNLITFSCTGDMAYIFYLQQLWGIKEWILYKEYIMKGWQGLLLAL